MLHRFVSIIIVIFCLTLEAKSQSIDSICSKTLLFVDHTEEFFASPFKNKNGELSNIAITVALTGIASLADKELKSFSQDGRHRTAFLGDISKIDRYYGSSKITALFLGGMLFTGFVTNNDDIFNAGFMLTESVILSNLITQPLKLLIGRERPDFTGNNYHFIGPVLSKDQFNALPSGHATTSFALSTVAAGLTDNTYLKVLCYTPAFLTSLSRIYNNRHWASDVLFGGLIGYYTGRKVLQMNGMIDKESNLDVTVGINSVRISFNF